ncbi:MAG: hypothetical protein J0H78_12950 [Rhizobiales bacterium]|nr:hypothetical protein [Hyphomicrobiales bacterium]OJY43446.1 MAG: hypothetical protein BGP08_01295 [Rhizobiales bacterium 64-17]
MPDDHEKKPKATRILLGQREPVKPSYEHRRVFQFTPNGTRTTLEPTPETRAYNSFLAKENGERERTAERMKQVPRAPSAKHDNSFKKSGPTLYDKKKSKDDDFGI